MDVLTVRSLTKRFNSFVAVDSIDFSVEQGEIFGFLGANGAGKSTTIRMLCGILPPTSGKATLLGIDVAEHPDRIKQSIGYMSQKFSLYDDLTVRENIEFFGGIHRLPEEELRRRADEIVQMAGLEGKERLRTGSLSGGWKQKLALGCSMIHRPRVLFLDEPTAGVDPAARRVFWDIIFDLRKRGTTVFVTSHYMDEVEQCDRIALMHRGRIAALGSPSALKRDVIPGEVLEIHCDRPAEARPILAGIPGILRIDPFGKGFHAVTDRKATGRAASTEKTMAKAVGAALAAKGIALERVSTVKPGLEDVFVYLIGSLEEKDSTGEAS